MIAQFLEVDKEHRVFGLDLLRSVAILLVLFTHGDMILKENFPAHQGLWAIDGVDVFFVLSGFLIGGILLKQFSRKITGWDIYTFWSRRWYRTLPNYFFVMGILIFINIIFIKNYSFLPSLWQYFFFVQNFKTALFSFFPESWSLTIEEWFYILLPLVSFAFIRFFRRSTSTAVLHTALLLIVFSLSYKLHKSFQFTPGAEVFDYYFRKAMICRFDSLAVGVFAAWWNFTQPQTFFKFRTQKCFAGLALILISIISPLSQLKLIFGSLGFSIGLMLCLPVFASFKKYPGYLGDLILYISVVSYSLYLFHFSIVLWFLTGGVSKYGSAALTMAHYAAYFLLSFIISTVNYKYFELPFLKKRDA